MTLVVAETVDKLPVGETVEVRSRFEASWARGFEVVEHTDRGYRVKRLSDGTVLPTDFDEDDVRRERRRSMWWY